MIEKEYKRRVSPELFIESENNSKGVRSSHIGYQTGAGYSGTRLYDNSHSRFESQKSTEQRTGYITLKHLE